MLTQVLLNVDPRGTRYKNGEIRYEVWMPDGECKGVVYENGEWDFTHPFETWAPDAEKPGSGCMSVEFILDQGFRTSNAQDTPKIPMYDRTGNLTKEFTVKRKLSDMDGKKQKRTVLFTSFAASSVAFGVYAYVLAPRGSHNPCKVWTRAAAAVVPWTYLHKSPVAVETFMWFDMRMNTESAVNANEFLIIQTPSGVPHFPTKDLAIDVQKVVREYTIPEFDVLRKCRLPPDSKYDESLNTITSTLNTPIDGLAYDVDATFSDGEKLPNEFMGASAQAWYYYTTPVVTEGWILQHMHEVMWLRQYDSGNYVEDVAFIIKGDPWPDADAKRYQRLLTDVIRLVTMHATSSPYVEDKRYDASGKGFDSDSYTSALKVPGDCEDGAHSAYMIYMSLLFGTWIDPRVKALQKLAAYLGMPMCVTGTAANPMRGGVGGTHAFGCVVPFPRFVKALYGDDEAVTKEAFQKFYEKFDFHFPVDSDPLDVSAIETTLYSTPLVSHHECHPESETVRMRKVKDFAVKEMREVSCASINFSYTFVLDSDCACHMLAFKAFTTAHRKLFYEVVDPMTTYPKTMDDKESTEHSCTFAFCSPGGVGVQRAELYMTEHYNGWELRVPHSMSAGVWEADVRLVRNGLCPVTPLTRRYVDPQKKTDHNADFVLTHASTFIPSEPHILVFVYDIDYMYPLGGGKSESTPKKLAKLGIDLGARHMSAGLYDKSVAVVYSDFED